MKSSGKAGLNCVFVSCWIFCEIREHLLSNFTSKINMRHLQRQERCGGRQDFARPCGENTSKFKTRKQIHNIQSGLGSILNEEDIPICIKYMLVFSWVINFEVNWRSLNSKDSWGHWQHVWLIMTHESTLTLVIAGSWWAGHSTWEFEGKWFPLPHSSLLSPPSVGKTTRESFFSPGNPSVSFHFLYLSPSRASCYFSFLHPV